MALIPVRLGTRSVLCVLRFFQRGVSFYLFIFLLGLEMASHSSCCSFLPFSVMGPRFAVVSPISVGQSHPSYRFGISFGPEKRIGDSRKSHSRLRVSCLRNTKDLNLSSKEVSEIPLKFLQFAKKADVFDWMVGDRRKIHENPELSYEEFETSKLIREVQEKMAIEHKYPLAGTGSIGFIGSGKPPFVAIRADMDALSLQAGFEFNVLLELLQS